MTSNTSQAGGSIVKAIFVFLFVFLATTVILSYFLSTIFIIALGMIIVISFALGYGFPSLFGLVLAAVLWIAGVISGLIHTITDPFSNLFSMIGFIIIKFIMG